MTQAEIAATLRQIRDEVRENRDDTRLVKKMLTGNGKPETGALWRISAVEKKVGIATKLLWAMLLSVVTAIGGVLGLRMMNGEAQAGQSAETREAE